MGPTEKVSDIRDAFRAVNAPGDQRVVSWFDIPEPIATQTGVSKVGIIELSSEEEMMSTNRAGGSPIKLAFELAKESVRFVNDQPLSTGDLSADTFWNSKRPGMSKVRSLCLAAYGVIHNPAPDEAAAFLKSRRQVAK